MRIGVIHNYYRSDIPSGENLTVDAIIGILRDLGHEVNLWSHNSNSVAKSKKLQLLQVFRIFFADRNRSDFKRWLSNQEAIQIHNYFPGITFANLKNLEKSGIPIIRVIHNYRKTCIKGNHYRNGNVCHKCSMSSNLSGIIRKCYNNTLLISAFVAVYSKRIKLFEHKANLNYVAISETIENYLLNLGIPIEKIHLIPNSVSAAQKISEKAKDCVFFGRIEEEKGILTLLEAWKSVNDLPFLHVVGNGTKLSQVRKLAAGLDNVLVHGAKFGEELEEILQKCKVAIFPGSWKEPFGRTLIESLAMGQAIASSSNFSLLESVLEGVNGSIFELNSKSIVDSVRVCLNLEIQTQISTSQRFWEKNYSKAAISKKWEYFYANKK